MSKATSWDPLEALLVPSFGTNSGGLRDDAARRPDGVEMAAVLPLCLALMRAPGFRPTTGCPGTVRAGHELVADSDVSVVSAFRKLTDAPNDWRRRMRQQQSLCSDGNCSGAAADLID